jgi:uncharacterized membrane protein
LLLQPVILWYDPIVIFYFILFYLFIFFLVTFVSTNIKGDEPFLEDGSQTVLHVESIGHAFHAFINGKLAGDWQS